MKQAEDYASLVFLSACLFRQLHHCRSENGTVCLDNQFGVEFAWYDLFDLVLEPQGYLCDFFRIDRRCWEAFTAGGREDCLVLASCNLWHERIQHFAIAVSCEQAQDAQIHPGSSQRHCLYRKPQNLRALASSCILCLLSRPSILMSWLHLTIAELGSSR